MNRTRRAMIKKASGLLKDAGDLIEIAYEEEDEALNSVPENMLSGQKFIDMEAYVENLEVAVDAITEAQDAVDNILNP